VLRNSEILNNSNLSLLNFSIANYTGKIAHITLGKFNDTGIMDTIISDADCYIIPQESSITVTVNSVYAIYPNINVGSAKLSAINNYFGSAVEDVFTQSFMIYDITHDVWYNIIPNSAYAYAFKVYNLTEDNTSVDSVSYDMSDMGHLYFPNYYTDTQMDDFTPIPALSNDNNTSWLNFHLITVAGLFVAGVVLSGSRDSGTRTIGKLLIIAGIGLGVYWYVYPYVASTLSFIDKLMLHTGIGRRPGYRQGLCSVQHHCSECYKHKQGAAVGRKQCK